MKDGAQVVLFNNVHRKKVFLVKRTDFPVWVEMGGGIEEGESPRQAAIREAEEETGFCIKLGRQILEYNLIDNKGSIIRKEYVFEGWVISGKYIPEFIGNIGKWYPVNQLPSDLSIASKRRILDVTKYTDHKQVMVFKREAETIWDYKTLMIKHPVYSLSYLFKRLIHFS